MVQDLRGGVGEQVEQGLGRIGIRQIEAIFDPLDPGEVGGAVVLGLLLVAVVDDGAGAGTVVGGLVLAGVGIR